MTYRQRQSRRRKRRGGHSKLVLALGVVAIAIVIAICSVAGYVLAIASTAPELGELKPDDKGEVSVIFAADGSRLGFVQSDTIRRVVPFREMPPVIRQATVAIEDERFYQHEGIDVNAIVRAGIKNLESRDTVQGGSTITQQLVRALYIRDPVRTFARKIREAKLASELEKKHSKRWILHEYLNSVPYGTVGGRTAVGIHAAAVTFFAKHVKDLNLDEAALLAGLPQAPSEYNPFRNPAAALRRRNEVLRNMVENGYITAAEADEASRRGLNLKHGTRYTTRREPYFFDYVQEQLIEKYGVGVVRRGGLKIHTTIKPALQDSARQAIDSYVWEPTGPSSAIVSVDPSNGEIKAMASSGTYQKRSFNLAAQGHRQPGSAFKTFVLTAAIRSGVDPDSTSYASKPLNINDRRYGPWQVKTYDGSYRGTMSLYSATLASDNTVYAQLILDIGPKKVCQTAKLMGIRTKLDCYPAEGLGGLRLGVTPLEMAGAYATLAAGGIRHRPTAIRKVVFPDGKSEELSSPKGKRVLTDGQAYEVTRILKANVQSGTGRTASGLGCPAAGKTGTTDNNNDAWFVGYTPHLTTAVWLGYPDALISTGEQGGGTPTSIWTAYMRMAKGDDCSDFPQPEEPFQPTPFHGKYASTGSSTSTSSSGSYYSSPSTGTQSYGGQSYGGYDPNLYESPPQQAPPVQTPEQVTPAPAPAPGNGNGLGNGGGGGPPGQE